MNIPVRLVCPDCGRSVEGESVPSGLEPALCPSCGATLSDAANAWAGPVGIAPSPADAEPVPSWTANSDRVMPDAIGRFRPRAVLGGGGFGRVYLAYDPRLERDVALKVLRDVRPVARVEQRFFREARAAAQLDHPNIVPLHDAGREPGASWIAYQYVPGITLARHRDERRIGPVEAVRIVRALADALDHAHERGVFHRDLKPANVLIDAEGRPRLTDFGLARRADADPTMTFDGAVLGTPHYMSPEQAAGDSHRADARSDVYSLGVIFHELLGGRPAPAIASSAAPGGAGSPPATPKAAMPPTIASFARPRSAPRALHRICLRALAVSPSDRYPDARALVDALDSWLLRRARRARLLRNASLAALVLVAVAIAVADAMWPRGARTSAMTQARPFKMKAADARVIRAKATITPGTPAPATTTYFVEKGKRFFHRAECVALQGVQSSERYSLSSAAEASAKHYFPCMKCQPR